MKILVINAGSSTLKFQLFDNGKVNAKGNVERINEGKSFLRFKANGKETIFEEPIKNHKEAMEIVVSKLTDENVGVLKNINEIDAFGHRVVNVGEDYFDSCLVTREVLEDFKTKVDFSPLHVPGSIAGIEACFNVSLNTPNVAVFDIGFHKTMPEYVYRYAIPKRYYTDLKIRRYGAHGTSHKYVARRCAELLGKKPEELKIVSCHLGSGASITAVKNGASFDTSMGFTPLEGIMMNTRSGDIDPAVVEFICNKDNKTVSEVIRILNKESGLLGANGVCSDMREILEKIDNPDVALSLQMYNHRIKKYIGAYAAAMGGLDAIIFTAGVGEHTPEVREAVTDGLEFLGVKVDHDKNYGAARGAEQIISSDDSRVKVLIIPTDEEFMIASDTEKIVTSLK